MTDAQYEDNGEHLEAEFALLDLLLRREVLCTRLPPASEPQFFKGVYLSEAEIDGLLGERSSPGGEPQLAALLDELRSAASALRLEIEARQRAALERGVFLALPHLARLFGLTPFETRAAAICLALEADLKYEKLYAFLQDDITRKRPSVDLILRLLCEAPAGDGEEVSGGRLRRRAGRPTACRRLGARARKPAGFRARATRSRA